MDNADVTDAASESAPQEAVAASQQDAEMSTDHAQDTGQMDSSGSSSDTMMKLDISPSPPLTHALETLLRGLAPSAPAIEKSAALDASDAQVVKQDAAFPAVQEPADGDAPAQPTALMSSETVMLERQSVPIDAESVLGTTASAPMEGVAVPETVAEGEQPEWEADSSPYESSSDDSSSDDSSSDESEGDNAYKLLSVEEQAKILMQVDSDDEEGGKPKGPGSQLRTKNEVPEVVIPKPDVIVTADMKIEELGLVEQIVDTTVLIKGKTSGDYRVLESGSVVCLDDRSIVGAIAETIGRVQQPFYSVLFTNAEEIRAVSLSIGTKVYYSEQHSTFAFTQALKAFKGSDASNLHDEEVDADEMEFSDDEKEAEHKKRVKQKKMEKRNGPGARGGRGGNRGVHPLQQWHGPYDSNGGISYDEAEDDGPYRTLPRPSVLAENVPGREAPEEKYMPGVSYNHRPSSRDQNQQAGGRGRADRGRGRGDRGRGRGDRGRGGGVYQDQRNHRNNSSNGYSQPLQNHNQQYPQCPPPPPFVQPGQVPPSPFNWAPQQQYSPQAPQMPVQMPGWPQFPLGFPTPQQFQSNQSNQNAWPSIAGVPNASVPNGAFINPAFFGNSQQGNQQWNQQNQNQQGPSNGGSGGT